MARISSSEYGRLRWSAAADLRSLAMWSTRVEEPAVVRPRVVENGVAPLETEIVHRHARLVAAHDLSVDEADLFHEIATPFIVFDSAVCAPVSRFALRHDTRTGRARFKSVRDGPSALHRKHNTAAILRRTAKTDCSIGQKRPHHEMRWPESAIRETQNVASVWDERSASLRHGNSPGIDRDPCQAARTRAGTGIAAIAHPRIQHDSDFGIPCSERRELYRTAGSVRFCRRFVHTRINPKKVTTVLHRLNTYGSSQKTPVWDEGVARRARRRVHRRLCSAAFDAAGAAYTQLQVLLPGETAAPGTVTGKLGTPRVADGGGTVHRDREGVRRVVVLCDDGDRHRRFEFDRRERVAPRSGGARRRCRDVHRHLQRRGVVHLFRGRRIRPDDPGGDLGFRGRLRESTDSSFRESARRTSTRARPCRSPSGRWTRAAAPYPGFSGEVRLQEITSFGLGRISPDRVTLSSGEWSGSVTMYRADETSINRGNVNIYARSRSRSVEERHQRSVHRSSGSVLACSDRRSGTEPVAGERHRRHRIAGDAERGPVVRRPGVLHRLSTGTRSRAPTWCGSRRAIPERAHRVSGALNNGYRQFSVSLGTVGTQTLTITDQTNGSIQGMTSQGIPVIPSAPDHFEINTIASPVTAGASVPVTIRATDVGGNTIPDYSGNAILSANTGPASISPELIAFTNGVWSGQMVFRGAGGAVSFTVRISPRRLISERATASWCCRVRTRGFRCSSRASRRAAGRPRGTRASRTTRTRGRASSMTVRAVDEFWNRVPGINNGIALSSTDAFADMPAETTLTNGERIFPVTLFRAGEQTITASDTDAGGITPHTSRPGDHSPGDVRANRSSRPGRVDRPGDARGAHRDGDRPIDQFRVYAHRLRDRRALQSRRRASPTSCGSRRAIRWRSSRRTRRWRTGARSSTCRLSTGGFQQITASNVTNPSMPSSTTQVRMISSGFHLEAEVSPTTVQAGEPFNLTVKVTNDAGSVIQEINSAVTVEVQNASTQDPGRGTLLNTQFQLLQGQRTVAETYTFAEPIVLIVRDDAGNVPAVTEVITILPGPPASMRLSSDPAWVRGNKHATIYAALLDAFENGVPGEPIAFELVSGLGTLTPIDTATADDGRARADFLSAREPGFTRIRATWDDALRGARPRDRARRSQTPPAER